MIDFKVTRQLRSLVREPGPSLVSEAAPISPLLVRRDGSMVRIVTRLQVYFGPNKRVCLPNRIAWPWRGVASSSSSLHVLTIVRCRRAAEMGHHCGG
jgi:hypothetical protein